MLYVLLSRTLMQSFEAIRLKLCLVASDELFAHFLPLFWPKKFFGGLNEKNKKAMSSVLLSRTLVQSFRGIRLKLNPVASAGRKDGRTDGRTENIKILDSTEVENIYIYIYFFIHIIYSHISEMSNITHLRFIFRDISSDTEILNSIRNHGFFFRPKGGHYGNKDTTFVSCHIILG